MLAGLVLLVLALALWLLRGLLVGALSHLPVIGWAAARLLGGLLDDARTRVIHGAESAFTGAERLFAAMAHWAVAMWDGAVAGLEHAGEAVWHVAVVQIPREITAARRYAAQLAGQAAATAVRLAGAAQRYAAAVAAAARGYARALVTAAEAAARRDVAAAEATALAWVTDAERYAQRAAAAVESTALAEIRQVDQYLSAAVAAAEHDLTAGLRYAEQSAAHDLTRAEDALRTAIGAASAGVLTDVDRIAGRALRDVWPQADRDIEALRRSLAGGYQDIADLLRALGGAGSTGLAGVLATAVAAAAALTRLADECIVPGCDNLGQFGAELHALLGDAATAAMLAWLVLAVTDPVRAADDTATVAGAVIDPLLGPLTDLLSAGAVRL